MDVTITASDGTTMCLPVDANMRGKHLRQRLDAHRDGDVPRGVQAWDYRFFHQSELWYGGEQVTDTDVLVSLGVDPGARMSYKPGTACHAEQH